MRLFLAVLLVVLVACRRDVAGGAVDGAKVYAEVCARCHGPSGVPTAMMAAQLGVRDLADPAFQASATAASIEQRIREGKIEKGMPAFAGAISDDQIAALARFVRTLGPGAEAPAK